MFPRIWTMVALFLSLLTMRGTHQLSADGGDKKAVPAQGKAFTPLNIDSTLGKTDQPDKSRNDTPHKIHRVNFIKGKVYQIDMTSTDFDAYLRLEDAAGRRLAEDDDGGGQLNARLIFQAPEDGDYRIIATAFNQDGSGKYHLTVAEEVPAKGTLDIRAALADTDPRDKIHSGPYKIHRVNFSKGKAYQIDLTSTEFDAFLRLEDAAGRQLAQDDDSGGNMNARIVFQALKTGSYRIIATTFGANGFGNYRLTVVEMGAAKPTKEK